LRKKDVDGQFLLVVILISFGTVMWKRKKEEQDVIENEEEIGIWRRKKVSSWSLEREIWTCRWKKKEVGEKRKKIGPEKQHEVDVGRCQDQEGGEECHQTL
jgi:hypothetical protein